VLRLVITLTLTKGDNDVRKSNNANCYGYHMAINNQPYCDDCKGNHFIRTDMGDTNCPNCCKQPPTYKRENGMIKLGDVTSRIVAELTKGRVL
tara:strand:+ start:421 stop:699 length:279 start_codon:yes stop_codon:yes gene_type:complete